MQRLTKGSGELDNLVVIDLGKLGWFASRDCERKWLLCLLPSPSCPFFLKMCPLFAEFQQVQVLLFRSAQVGAKHGQCHSSWVSCLEVHRFPSVDQDRTNEILPARRNEPGIVNIESARIWPLSVLKGSLSNRLHSKRAVWNSLLTLPEVRHSKEWYMVPWEECRQSRQVHFNDWAMPGLSPMRRWKVCVIFPRPSRWHWPNWASVVDHSCSKWCKIWESTLSFHNRRLQKNWGGVLFKSASRTEMYWGSSSSAWIWEDTDALRSLEALLTSSESLSICHAVTEQLLSTLQACTTWTGTQMPAEVCIAKPWVRLRQSQPTTREDKRKSKRHKTAASLEVASAAGTINGSICLSVSFPLSDPYQH